MGTAMYNFLDVRGIGYKKKIGYSSITEKG